MLAATGVTVAYPGRAALDHVSVAVAPGELVGLIGPNGSGKSTLLSVILGLKTPDAGGVTLGLGGGALRLGAVFQQPVSDRYLTVAENLVVHGALHGVAGKMLRDRAAAAMARAGLADRAHNLAGTLSGGLRRRLELAQALLHDPDVLLLDEPTTGLDPGAAAAFWEDLEAPRRERGMAVLAATHDMADAERCDRLVMLDRGRVVAEGTPAALKDAVGGPIVITRPPTLADAFTKFTGRTLE